MDKRLKKYFQSENLTSEEEQDEYEQLTEDLEYLVSIGLIEVKTEGDQLFYKFKKKN